MYSIGEKIYLEDLDWVNIIKSIRELKTLVKIVLDQHQSQLIFFEKESILPQIFEFKKECLETIQDKVPFENVKNIKTKQDYFKEIDRFAASYLNRPFSDIDFNIINKIYWEKNQLRADSRDQNKIHPWNIRINKAAI